MLPKTGDKYLILVEAEKGVYTIERAHIAYVREKIQDERGMRQDVRHILSFETPFEDVERVWEHTKDSQKHLAYLKRKE